MAERIMLKKIINNVHRISVFIYLLLAFFYVVFVTRPAFYFHHTQAPFLFASDFINPYLSYPGGIAELIATFVQQVFYYPVAGLLLFFLIGITLYILYRWILQSLFRGKYSSVWALIPFSFSIFVVNNYNFPYAVMISLLLLLLIAGAYIKAGNRSLLRLLIITVGSTLVYYVSGSGFLLLLTLMLIIVSFIQQRSKAIPEVLLALLLTILLPVLSRQLIFTEPDAGTYPEFFREQVYFKNYSPSPAFYFLLISLPLIPVITIVFHLLRKRLIRIDLDNNRVYLACIVTVLGFSVFAHLTSYSADGFRSTATDYYCYQGNAEKVKRHATRLEEYNFSVNINYNMAMAKSGRINEDLFSFFQVSGINALYPDVAFSSEMAFISADFYYDLGYISEARHWAYEALVFYPYSPRALRLLTKVHLVTGEYAAAARNLHMLDKGIINRKFVEKYLPMVKDTALIIADTELIEKRKSMPGAHELDPYIVNRFAELLTVNKENIRAYEYLMLYYLLDGDLENFLLQYQNRAAYFSEPQTIYEEAVLMYGLLNNKDVLDEYDISHPVIQRFNAYRNLQETYKGNKKIARNALYWEMGDTYMYYLQYVEPRIILPEINDPDHEEPQL